MNMHKDNGRGCSRKCHLIFCQTSTSLLSVGRDQRDLVSQEFSRIFFHFHFSFSISNHFNFTFTSRKRVKRFYFPLFTSRKKWKLSVFHSFFSRKRVKSDAGYNLTSIFVPNCISNDSHISSKHQPQNIRQISDLKSWTNSVLLV